MADQILENSCAHLYGRLTWLHTSESLKQRVFVIALFLLQGKTGSYKFTFMPKNDGWKTHGFRVTVVTRYDLIHQWVVRP